MQHLYRSLPSVDRVLNDPRIGALAAGWRPGLIAALARQQLDAARSDIAAGRASAPPGLDDIVAAVLRALSGLERPSLRTVINATGVVLHTNLGRAPLSSAAAAALAAASGSYSNLEFDLPSGERGSRQVHIEGLLRRLTGAEDALVVNNNAAAVLLGLSALAHGGAVAVSRGEAVEIGGGFRIPDVLRQSGAALVEVGTTNRTRVADYEAAATPEMRAFLRVHASNFKIVGFTERPALPDLAQAARAHGVLLLDDLGSGCLLDTAAFGLDHEPTVQESLAGGADLVFFSGDKLLGGPQAGIVAGRGDLVAALRRHPLARAVRIDKGSLAALAATLLHYLKDEALTHIPIWRMIAAPAEEVQARAARWAAALGGAASVAPGLSYVGGGSLPGAALPTSVVALTPPWPGSPGAAAHRLAAGLRTGEPAVAARIERDQVLLDPRTVLPGQDEALLARAAQELYAHSAN